MQCPVCHVDLVMSDRQGIEIDYCPKCRGVWLDRGELDKIIERSQSDVVATDSRPSYTDSRPVAPRPDDFRPRNGYQGDDYRGDRHYGHDDYKHKKHKKEGFLGDLFDFGD